MRWGDGEWDEVREEGGEKGREGFLTGMGTDSPAPSPSLLIESAREAAFIKGDREGGSQGGTEGGLTGIGTYSPAPSPSLLIKSAREAAFIKGGREGGREGGKAYRHGD